MASSREYLRFILEQLSERGEITFRPMMGEFLLYDRGKLFGGIYDNRLLVKPVQSAVSYLRTVSYELPYEGAREMLLVDDVDDRAYLSGLLEAMYHELPAPKRERKKESSMKFIEGGVCAAQGFRAAGVHAGVKTHADWKKDVALIVSDKDCTAAGVFTKNVVKAAPVLVDMEHLKDGKARAVIANSGNANACAPRGEENAFRMCRAAAAVVGCRPEDILVSSTGVIGQTLNIKAIEDGIEALCDALEHSPEASDAAAHAIMTTDTRKKEAAVETMIGGKTVRIGGIAKGSGMIHPNMGTMLCFLTTDCAVSADCIRKALLEAAAVSFNRISVDGDTSTNDSCMVLANGLAGNAKINASGPDYDAFRDALTALCVDLAKKMASDGEGAKHLITCTVSGARSVSSAETIAKSVISSTLTKAAIFGADANWGRVLCAMGYSGETFDPDTVNVSFASAAGEIAVCRNGRGLEFDEDAAKKILTEHDIEIRVGMKEGACACTCWGCDITYDYIRINGDYRT